MNWSLVAWFAGVLITFGALKFVWAFFRELTSKDARQRVVDAVGDRINEGARDFGNYVKMKTVERKQRKQEENKPIITIR